MEKVTEEMRERRFSKNMATINYWLSQQNFTRYDSLYWETEDGVTRLYFSTVYGPVAKVTWFTMMKDNIEYHVPIFEFLGMFSHWNGNQLSFWICDHMNRLLGGERG